MFHGVFHGHRGGRVARVYVYAPSKKRPPSKKVTPE